jgi:hypothetical protein
LDKVFGVGVKNLFTKIVLKAAAIFGTGQWEVYGCQIR